MYNISALPSQNVYAPPVASKKAFNAAFDTVFAPSAAEKYEQTGGSEITADNLYDILAERAKTSAEKLAEYDFSDMYVKSAAHQFQLTESQRNAIRWNGFETFHSITMSLKRESWDAAKNEDCILVPIGPGELPQFMDEIMQALSDGMSLTDALNNKIEDLKNNNISFDGKDFFFINPTNGDVVGCDAKGRGFFEYGERFADYDAALELADDLATFFRYVAFPQEGDGPEKVASLISYIKDKQAYANYDRYIFDESPNEIMGMDNNAYANLIIANLTAAGVLKGEDDEEEEEESIDMLMEAVKEHQETLREDMIDREKSELAMEEIKEILYSMA
ncbi:MAG: hypothetical protein J1F60_00610 [Oscillospiraceae bacterium]|nr:hypothetical protein [Oscillospiraceae bacterium]